MVFSEVVGTLSFLQPQADDDFADRLHYYYTSTFLLVTAVLISLKMFGGRPIECWVPAEYKGGWEDYTEMFCWARSTYWVSFDEDIPEDISAREERMVSYYQWTPFFLVICAFFFYSPCLVWRLMYTKSGIRLKDIMQFATDKSNIQPASRRANVQGLSAHLSSIFKHRFRLGNKHPSHHRCLKLLNMRYFEAYLTLLYIFIKILYLLNVVGQMFLMNRFLQTDDYSLYGVEVLKDLLSGRPWTESGNFPRVTLCDMNIRILGNVQRHTVQCVLVINIFTEKVFILLWMWYCLLAIVSTFSCLSWLFFSVPFEQRKKFIARRLELADIEFKKKDFSAELDEFVREHIKLDGVFVLKMLTVHGGMLMCTEVVDNMWDNFLREQGKSEEGKERTPSGTPGVGFDFVGGRRKMSVLVPLVSREDHHEFIRAPSIYKQAFML
ncbi:Innexin-10 [Toxocara canis]|uniref:Innexin n=1 Tax=Toxocara canis TaxID=6265 RepID=A0A0B2URA3_TOXCA|nr:Innexin-10 [Toxocara canis]